jgi:hypothetical protein
LSREMRVRRTGGRSADWGFDDGELSNCRRYLVMRIVVESLYSCRIDRTYKEEGWR